MLPIENSKELIVRTVSENSVTIINGTTGCGKSTMLPIFLAEAGYRVIVTEPRRIAAISLASTVSNKFGEKPIGEIVGYKTGIENNYSDNCQILYLTEESEVLRLLYNKEDLNGTVLVIDEVHEWHKEVDILLAYAKNIIQAGTNLKLVLMSATIEEDKLSNFFGGASLINIASRKYSITSLSYEAKKMAEIILIQARNRQNVLVFLPGKSEVLSMKSTLIQLFKSYSVPNVILELYSEISLEEQQKVFQHYRVPKIILATNIAQTSITIPDINVVVDSGLEKCMEFNNGVSTLVTKQCSKSDCIQRKGRAGRNAPGVYFLCSDYKYKDRAEFPEPEIYRADLSSSLLSLLCAGVNPSSLDYLHKPSSLHIKDAMTLLNRLGAIDCNGNVTDLGNKMNSIPLDSRSSRMMVEAKKYGVEFDVLICCLLLETGFICFNHSVLDCEMKKYNSDLIAELLFFKSLSSSENNLSLSKNVRQSNYDSICSRLKKLIKVLQIDKKYGNSLDITNIKKCLATGYYDMIFTFISRVGFKNSISSCPRSTFTNSSISRPEDKQLFIGSPMDFYNLTSSHKRISILASYTYEEAMEFMPQIFEEQHFVKDDVIFKRILCNDIELFVSEVGSVEDLKVSEPESFHNVNETFKKFNQTCISLYYKDVKISSLVTV